MSRTATSRVVAVLLLVVTAGLLASCDIGGQQTNNSYQRVSNSIP